MEEKRLSALIYDMNILLKKYDGELLAYHQVFVMVENEAKKLGISMNINSALESMCSSPALARQVDDMYRPLDTLAQSWTAENLDRAAFEIQKIQKLRGVVKVNLPQTDPKGPIQ